VKNPTKWSMGQEKVFEQAPSAFIARNAWFNATLL
jgi:hypothetical protein